MTQPIPEPDIPEPYEYDYDPDDEDAIEDNAISDIDDSD